MYEIELRAQGIDSMPTAPRRQQLPYIVITYSVRAFDYSFFLQTFSVLIQFYYP